jgi:L-rhamnose isomerase
MVPAVKSGKQAYAVARECYAEVGVDTEAALARLSTLPISMHCWQGDDVTGFEGTEEGLGGGLAVTGNYPGKARTAAELRQDLKQALRLIPGRHRLNLHACYGEFAGERVDRDAIEAKHFQGWIAWAKQEGLGLDFNPTCFAHRLAADGFTLSHPQESIRSFWIAHCLACREIGAVMGEALGTPTTTNIWVPDGYKDIPVDRLAPRERLAESLDAIFRPPLSTRHHADAVECKLFGIGSESYVVGSHEFYFGYAIKHQKMLCLDAGHFHPTESIADKLSSTLMYVPRLLLHVSRGVRWDSDHVVILDDALQAMMAEVVRHGWWERVQLGLDFFDASINRIAAWVIGMRSVLKALLIALLEPPALQAAERALDLTGRLGWMEEAKALPWAAVWDHYCRTADVPVGQRWLDEVRHYEQTVLARRSDR